MIDELDLAFDENTERGKPRHRRGSRRSKGRGGKSAVAFLMAFVLLAALGGGVYFGYNKIKGFFTAADYDGAGTGTVQVQIKDNSTLTEMGNVLVDADVVKSTKAFTDAAEENPRGKNIQSGTFNLRRQMSGAQAVTLMLDPGSRVSNGVTIPEGKTTNQVYDILAKASGLPVKDFETAGKDPGALGVPDFWFNRTDGQKVTRSIEGFLFPDTYEFEPGATATQMLESMVAHFMAVTKEITSSTRCRRNARSARTRHSPWRPWRRPRRVTTTISARSPGSRTTGSTAATSRAAACSSTSGSTTTTSSPAGRRSRPSPCPGPSWRIRRTRTARTASPA